LPPDDSRAVFKICPTISASNCLAAPAIFSGVSVEADCSACWNVAFSGITSLLDDEAEFFGSGVNPMEGGR